MDYQLLYDKIIEHARLKNRKKGEEYFERHHILPKSLGGDNRSENLVLLTAKEHFICHYLLLKIHKDNKNNYKKMLHAFMLLRGGNGIQPRGQGGRLYEAAKIEYGIQRSVARSGQLLSDEQKKKISISMMGHSVSPETRAKISKKASERKRKPFSDEYKKKMSEIMKVNNRHAKKKMTSF